MGRARVWQCVLFNVAAEHDGRRIARSFVFNQQTESRLVTRGAGCGVRILRAWGVAGEWGAEGVR